MTHRLPGIFEMSQEVTAQQRYVQIAMAGMAAQTGMSGSATLPATKNLAIGPRKNMCISYMPNESFERPVTAAGAFFASMQENMRKAPNEVRRTFGVQNSQAHSRAGVSMIWPGTPLNQNDQPVNAAPMRKHNAPVLSLFALFQSRWKRM